MHRLFGLLFIIAALLTPSAAFAESWPSLSSPAKQKAEGKKDAVLIIGIEDYFAAPDVPGAVQNAQDWYMYFIDSRKVPVQNVRLLRNNKASIEKIKKQAAEMAKKAKKGGTLWVIFIGHGAPAEDGKDGMLVGVDAQQDPDSLYARSIAQKELIKILKKGKQKNTVLVIDACFSGKAGKNKMLAEGLQPMIPVKQAPSEVTILSAGGGSEFAGPLPGVKRPAFSYLVLGAMRGWGDEDGDGKVTAEEAVGYARVVLETTVNDRSQTPQVISKKTGLVLASGGSETGPSLSKMVLGAVETASPTVLPRPTPISGQAPEGMVLVPAGEFTMGSNSGDGDEKPVREVYLDTYAVDKTEVTVAAYEQCVNAGGCTTPNTAREMCSGKYGPHNNWTHNRSDHPVNCVDWSQAKTYCAWASKRLPTEAEWEKAARGTDGRKYPWGNGQATCRNAIVFEGGMGCGRDSTWPVGSKPSGASPYGALDMAGNVSEWTADWYGFYDASATRNPRGPSTGSERVLRGGGIGQGSRARSAGRFSNGPVGASDNMGFRCVQSVSP